MKIKKFNKSLIANIVFTFMFITIITMNIFVMEYVLKLKLVASYNNKPYNNSSVTFLIDSDRTTIDFGFLAKEEKAEDCVLLKNNDVLSGYEVIYCGNNAVEFSYKDFDIWDFNSNKKGIVVGQNTGYKIGDIIRLDDEYKVFGVLDRHISEIVNEELFFTKSNISEAIVDSSYILASKDTGMVKDAFQIITDELKNKDIDFKEIDVRKAEFGDFLDYSLAIKILLIATVVFTLIIIFLIRWLWIKVNTPYFFVLNILGDRFTSLRINGKYLILWAVSILFSMILFAILKVKIYYGVIPIIWLMLILSSIMLVSLTKRYHLTNNIKYN